MTQREAVIQTLERLGGIATLGTLYQEVFKITECTWKTKTPFASIRQIVQLAPEIYKIKPGLWALESHRKELESNGIFEQTEKNKESAEVKNFNHSYYQGLLLTMGNLRGKNTFVPNQDKNKRFDERTLGQIRTLNSIPEYSFSDIVQRSSTIDVIWFNQRNMPDSFFEVEHSTDIQNSLLKFEDLIDFSARMFIVADAVRKEEYQKKMNYDAFKVLKDNKRVNFLSYEDLDKQYNFEISKQEMQTVL